MARATGSYPVGHGFKSNLRYHIRPVGQAAKTPPFHGGNGSSILPRVTRKKHVRKNVLFSMKRTFRCMKNEAGFAHEAWLRHMETLNMKKHLANIVTASRIMFSIVLLFFDATSLPFYITYLLCGFSDMIDGTIARKTNSVSDFGSKLDTVSDFIFLVACSTKLLPILKLPIWIYAWIGIIAIIKITNIILGFTLNKKLIDSHTVLNKATGLLLFILPLTLQFINPIYSSMLVCIIATISALQESYFIVLKNQKKV